MPSIPYSTERLLVESFVDRLARPENPWGQLRVSLEFDYQRGRTDVVALTSKGDVLAFEVKLTRWRDALHQAYRNRCFADASFVVLPKGTALRASSFSQEFLRRGVGICYVSEDEGVVIVHESAEPDPVLPWLRTAVVDRVSGAAG